VISYEVGVEKPDRRIFEIAMAEAGVQHPHEML
jgi:FMN phosphatase YigB (HAD superfamily)